MNDLPSAQSLTMKKACSTHGWVSPYRRSLNGDFVNWLPQPNPQKIPRNMRFIPQKNPPICGCFLSKG